LKFPLAGLADVGPDGEAEQMLGIDVFGMRAQRQQRAADDDLQQCCIGPHLSQPGRPDGGTTWTIWPSSRECYGVF